MIFLWDLRKRLNLHKVFFMKLICSKEIRYPLIRKHLLVWWVEAKSQLYRLKSLKDKRLADEWCIRNFICMFIITLVLTMVGARKGLHLQIDRFIRTLSTITFNTSKPFRNKYTLKTLLRYILMLRRLTYYTTYWSSKYTESNKSIIEFQ